MSRSFPSPPLPIRIVAFSAAAILAFAPALFGAQLGSTAQSVFPDTTRQIVSINYRRLGNDPAAKQVESQVLPPEMLNVAGLLTRGGVNPANDLDRLTFATYQAQSGVGLIGVADGNFNGLQLNKFFVRTTKNAKPEQYDGVNLYTDNGLSFIQTDPNSIVFGSLDAVKTAIDVEQGVKPHIDRNSAVTDLIAGTESTDVWSVLDPAGSRMMAHALIGPSPIPGLDTSILDKYFNGARYTVAFGDQIQINVQLVTTDPLGAATLSTGLRAAIDLRSRQEQNPAAKAVLNQVQVDSAGDNVFLQLASSEATLSNLLQTDLLKQITH